MNEIYTCIYNENKKPRTFVLWTIFKLTVLFINMYFYYIRAQQILLFNVWDNSNNLKHQGQPSGQAEGLQQDSI